MSKTETVESEIQMKKRLNFLAWVQEFTKKIVVITFIMYIISNIVFLGIAICYYVQSGGEVTYFSTLTTEVHETFRNVIGGYIVKAAVENAVKITGSIVQKIIEAKYGKSDSDPLDEPADFSSDSTSEDDVAG